MRTTRYHTYDQMGVSTRIGCHQAVEPTVYGYSSYQYEATSGTGLSTLLDATALQMEHKEFYVEIVK